MSNPLHAAHYADRAIQLDVIVEARRTLAKETYAVRLRCPEIASRITPGQFLMIRASRGTDPMLGRAFAVYDVIRDDHGEAVSIDVVFHVVGKLTQILADIPPGSPLVVWGPLGNGFQLQASDHLIMVAGGIGQTPFLALAKECLGLETFGSRAPTRFPQVSLCYGARSAELLAGVDDFKNVGVEVHVATDDGSAGFHGLVTKLLEDRVALSTNESIQIVCCGPEPMMEAVAKYCVGANVPCLVSLETPMACGLGICFSCVAPVIQADGNWDFKRTCVDGPVFDAKNLAW